VQGLVGRKKKREENLRAGPEKAKAAAKK